VRRGLLAVAAVAALVALPRETAPGGVPLVDKNGVPYKWDLTTEQPNVQSGHVTYYPDTGSLRDDVTGQQTPLEAIRGGVHEWEIGTTTIQFTEDTSRKATGPNGLDRVNWIGWVQSGLDSLTLASTTVTRDGSTITDMDVALNGHNFTWDTFAPGRAGIADIQSLVTHEWGHAIGCDHVPLRTSTMYYATNPGVISLRTLAADDRALIGSLYPNALFQSSTGTLSGVVTVAGTTNDRAVHVVAVSAVSGEPEASALTMPDGSYRIEGLPPGAYRVVAAPCIPLKGSMNEFWTSGSTSFLPSVLRQGPGNPAPVAPVAVVAGQTTAVPAMSVGPATAPFEPNDGPLQAKPIQIGDALCARFESGGDEDWYTFTGAAGQKISVDVLCWDIGAQADPGVRLVDSSGATVAFQDDARPPALYFSQIEGEDLDARLVGVPLPSSGTYYLALHNQSSSPNGNGFYALFLTLSSDAPSTVLTTVTATPARIDADGSSESLIVVHPKRETGDDVGPGATVTLSHSGAGSVAPVSDEGDGNYTAQVTAPTTPGTDRFTVVVTSPDGTATILDAVTIVYLGPADDAKSTFTVTPRRIDADVPAQATVTLVPRDVNGELLGKGRAVVMSLVAPPGASLAGTVDLLDGSYGDTVQGITAHGTGTVSAAVDGHALGVKATIAFGFRFADVLTDVQTDLARYLAVPGIGAKAAKAFKKAQPVVAKALAELGAAAPNAEPHAVAAAQTALADVLVGRRLARVHLDDPGTARDLARAIREAAETAIARAVVVTSRDSARVSAANDDVASGDAAFTANFLPKAAAAWRRAYSRVRPLQPH
jgi:hypothetical protein